MVLTLLLHCKLCALVVHRVIIHAMHHCLLLQTMSYQLMLTAFLQHHLLLNGLKEQKYNKSYY